MPEPAATGMPPELELAVALEDSFDGVYGLEVVADELPDGPLRGRVRVRPELTVPSTGLLHGGVLCAVAETLASRGTYLTVAEQGRAAMGLQNDTSFLRPVLGGHVHAAARPEHRGRSTWVWSVELRDDEGRLCATSRVTIAVR